VKHVASVATGINVTSFGPKAHPHVLKVAHRKGGLGATDNKNKTLKILIVMRKLFVRFERSAAQAAY
jgi:hypothetical protein